MTDEQIKDALKMWDGGARVADIHHTLDVPYSSAYTLIRRRRAPESARRYKGTRFNGTERLSSKELAKTAFMYVRLEMSSEEIAQALGKSPDTIKYRLQRAGVAMRTTAESTKLRWKHRGRAPITPSRWPELTQDRLDQTSRLYDLGLCVVQVAEVLGLNESTVRWRLSKNGTKMRKRHLRVSKACYTWTVMDHVDQRIALVFLENDHGPARTSSLLPDHPLCEELEIKDPPVLAEFDDGVRVIIQQDGGMIPLSMGAVNDQK